MTIEILFYTQLGSIFAFIVALFVLYRVLVHSKDATIQTLKEKCSYLACQLSEAVQSKPDALARSLTERVETLNKEIERYLKIKQAIKNSSYRKKRN